VVGIKTSYISDKEIFATIGVVVNPTKYNGTEEERVILQNEYNKLIRN